MRNKRCTFRIIPVQIKAACDLFKADGLRPTISRNTLQRRRCLSIQRFDRGIIGMKCENSMSGAGGGLPFIVLSGWNVVVGFSIHYFP